MRLMVFLRVIKRVFIRWLGACVSEVLEKTLHLLDGVFSFVVLLSFVFS